MSKSPWSHYGRTGATQQMQAETPVQQAIFQATQNVERSQQMIDKYVRGAVTEFSQIRTGAAGYQKMIRGMLQRSATPESIDETLRRLKRPPQAG